MSAVEVSTSAAKGRALVAARDVVAGEVVVDELPILLSVYDDAKDLACARCLRALNGGDGDGGNGAPVAPPIPCLSCHQVAFCSAVCAAAAEREPWVHAPATCRAYAAGLAALPEAPAGSADENAATATIEARSALRFLIQALALRALAMQQHQAGQADPITSEGAARYAQLLSLCVAGGPAASAAATAARSLLPALAAAVGSALPPEDEVAALLSREQANSFAVELPPPPPSSSNSKGAAPKKKGKGGASSSSTANPPKPPRRRLLGGALYAQASLVNHECLPNVARFDDFVPLVGASSPSAGPALATAVQGRLRLVALHALPKGTELALSYTPLRWPAAKRRAHLREVYGFDCACPRCALEARADVFRDARGGGQGGEDGESEWETDDEDEDDEWETEEEEDGMEEGGEADMEEEEEEQGAGGAEAADAGGATTSAPAAMDPTYLHLFLLKYVCPRKGCTGGTLAPVAPGQADVLRCNACGGQRTEAEFLAELNG